MEENLETRTFLKEVFDKIEKFTGNMIKNISTLLLAFAFDCKCKMHVIVYHFSLFGTSVNCHRQGRAHKFRKGEGASDPLEPHPPSGSAYALTGFCDTTEELHLFPSQPIIRKSLLGMRDTGRIQQPLKKSLLHHHMWL